MNTACNTHIASLLNINVFPWWLIVVLEIEHPRSTVFLRIFFSFQSYKPFQPNERRKKRNGNFSRHDSIDGFQEVWIFRLNYFAEVSDESITWYERLKKEARETIDKLILTLDYSTEFSYSIPNSVLEMLWPHTAIGYKM